MEVGRSIPPIPWLTALTSHPGLGQSPQGALQRMPWVLQAARLPPRALTAGRGLCTCRWVGCYRVLPVPAPSKGCAAFCIFSSHCHSNRLGAWVPALPAPASRSHPAHSPCHGALPVRHSQACTAQPGVWGASALGNGCLQHRASFSTQCPAQAHMRGLGGPPAALLSSKPSKNNVS